VAASERATILDMLIQIV